MTWRPRKKADRATAGLLCRVGNWPHQRISVLFLAFFFASFMTAASSAGAIKATSAAVPSHHHSAVADADEPHPVPCTTVEADPGCAEHNGGGHGHDDFSSTCCGFACHITMTAASQTLASPLGRSDSIHWIADPLRTVKSDPFDRPPRIQAL